MLVWVFTIGLLHGSLVLAVWIIRVSFSWDIDLAAWKGIVSCRLSFKGNLFKNP